MDAINIKNKEKNITLLTVLNLEVDTKDMSNARKILQKSIDSLDINSKSERELKTFLLKNCNHLINEKVQPKSILISQPISEDKNKFTINNPGRGACL